MINYLLSIGIGIITYLLLYLNNLVVIKNNIGNKIDDNIDYKFNVSLKVPLIISLLVLIILNNYSAINQNINIISATIADCKDNDIELYTDNVSYWF